MRTGFIGCGNVGGLLAGSLLRNGFDLTIRDLDRSAIQHLLDAGARWAESSRELTEACDIVITCLPSPDTCAAVMESANGVIAGLSPGKVWIEMSITDEIEVRRIGALVVDKGASALDCPVAGGCHRAANGNISIFVGGETHDF